MAKSSLNLYCQKKHILTPVYRCESTSNGFSCTVAIEDTEYTSLSSHSTKKEAEKDAASVAVKAVLSHYTPASTMDEVLKLMDGLHISGPSPTARGQPTSNPPTSSTTPSVTSPATPLSVTSSATPSVTSPAIPPSVTSPAIPPSVTSCATSSVNSHMSPSTHAPVNSPSGRVVQGVYYPASGPPPGFHQPPGFSPVPPSPLVTTPLSIPSHRPPMSIDGPSIDVHNRPSTATPVPFRAPSSPPVLITAVPIKAPLTSELSAGPPPLVSVRLTLDKDIKDLELYCQASNLPQPVYTIYQEKGKHLGKVRVGEMEFARDWGYDTFSEAKDSAAIVAIAGIAMIQLQLLSQQHPAGVSKGATPPPLCSVKLPANLTPNTQVPPPTNNGLQTPSHFQQPISHFQQPIPRGSTQPSPTQPTTAMSTNYKSLLNTYCQQNHVLPPVYECASPQDSSGYISTVTVKGRLYRSGVHGTKKAADTEAALLAAEELGIASEQEVRPAPPTKNPSPPPQTFVSYKNVLQERAQKERVAIPQYSTERVGTGFVSTVTVYSATDPTFTESSSTHPVKKAAEQEAARRACERLGISVN